MGEIIMVEIPQIVKLRRHKVDSLELCEFLRKHKTDCKLNNKQIAEILDVPRTNVEHWFRRDQYFSIPEEDIWFKLKELLNIQTNQYDAAIMEFDYEVGKFDMGNRHYVDIGIAPTITCNCNDIKVVVTNVKS